MFTNSKAISIFLTLVLAASLGACGGNKDTTPAGGASPTASPSK